MLPEHDSAVVRHRNDFLAPVYTLLEFVLLTPPSLRRKAVERLDMAAGVRILGVGFGTGRNPRLNYTTSKDGTKGG